MTAASGHFRKSVDTSASRWTLSQDLSNFEPSHPYRARSHRDDYDPPQVGDRVRPFDRSEFDGDGIVIGHGDVWPDRFLVVSVPYGLGCVRRVFWIEDLFVVQRAA